MTICWLSPWLLWTSSWFFADSQRPVLSPLSMAVLLIAATFLTKLLLRQSWPLEWIQASISGLGLLAILGLVGIEYHGARSFFDPGWLGDLFWALSDIFHGFPPQLAGLLLGGYFWWRGIALGRENVEFDRILGAFRLGVVAFIALLILSVASSDSVTFKAIQGQAIPAVLIFFFLSLLTLSLSKLDQVREEAKTREGKALEINRDWLVSLVLSVAGIVFLGFTVSSVFSFDLASGLLGLLLRLADLVVMIPLLAIALVLGLIAEYLIYFLRFIFSLFGGGGNVERPQMPENPFDEKELRAAAESKIPPEIIQAIEWAIVAIILAVIVYVLVRAVQRLRRPQVEADVEEVHESLWSWQVFADDVKAWLRAFWLRLAVRRQRVAGSTGADLFDADPRGQVSISIRQIYRSLLSQTARFGFPKKVDETPFEYLRVLEGTLPPAKEDLLAITQAYVQVRYSGVPPRAQEFQQVSQAWERVQTFLREAEEAKKGEKGKRGRG